MSLSRFEKILSAADFSQNQQEALLPLTLWIPVEAKRRYDRLQGASSRKFARTLKEIVIAAIEMAESKNCG